MQREREKRIPQGCAQWLLHRVPGGRLQCRSPLLTTECPSLTSLPSHNSAPTFAPLSKILTSVSTCKLLPQYGILLRPYVTTVDRNEPCGKAVSIA
ncbi:hypothetical protein M758_3G105900 [Ceratodon purpureus]|nr:hypothetical protein M758_3G105900 [Ceratodon purpureus]